MKTLILWIGIVISSQDLQNDNVLSLSQVCAAASESFSSASSWISHYSLSSKMFIPSRLVSVDGTTYSQAADRKHKEWILYSQARKAPENTDFEEKFIVLEETIKASSIPYKLDCYRSKNTNYILGERLSETINFSKEKFIGLNFVARMEVYLSFFDTLNHVNRKGYAYSSVSLSDIKVLAAPSQYQNQKALIINFKNLHKKGDLVEFSDHESMPPEVKKEFFDIFFQKSRSNRNGVIKVEAASSWNGWCLLYLINKLETYHKLNATGVEVTQYREKELYRKFLNYISKNLKSDVIQRDHIILIQKNIVITRGEALRSS